jgi:protein-disulfide isomerase
MSLRPPVSENDHIQGNKNAPIELLEYGDYQCPHCGRAYPILKHIQKKLGTHLKFVFRNFPLTNVHPDAALAAVATEAANRQGKYWEMHDIVFENQADLSHTALTAYAKKVGLSIPQFEKDLADPVLLQKVEADFESGIRSGVNGTPTFYINGQKYNYSWEGDDLLEYLNRNFAAAS